MVLYKVFVWVPTDPKRERLVSEYVLVLSLTVFVAVFLR